MLDLLLAVVGAAAVALPLISASNAKTDVPITATALTVLGGGIAIAARPPTGSLDPVGEGRGASASIWPWPLARRSPPEPGGR